MEAEEGYKKLRNFGENPKTTLKFVLAGFLGKEYYYLQLLFMNFCVVFILGLIFYFMQIFRKRYGSN